MKKSSLSICLFMTLVASGCSAGSPSNVASPTQPQASASSLTSPMDINRNDPDVLRFIETGVSGLERAEVYDYLALLPVVLRDNVIIVSAQGTLSNRPEFNETRQDAPLARFPPTPACDKSHDTCTGSFRQHQSKPGGSYVQAHISISCTNTHLTPNPYEAAYAYISNYATDNVTDWEGGLEEDPPANFPGSPSQISPYIKEVRVKFEDMLMSVGNPRLDCSQPSPVLIETYEVQSSASDTNPRRFSL